jgi:hypothetical protein
MQNRLWSKVREAVSRWHNDPHTADDGQKQVSVFSKSETSAPTINDKPVHIPETLRTSSPQDHDHGYHLFRKKGAGLHPVTETGDVNHHPGPDGEPQHNPSRANPADLFAALRPRASNGERTDGPTTLAQCDMPLKLNVKGENLVVDTQIQLYATNAQLCHPWVSPVLGYLGGLPPLFICAGDNEVLRDEIIYM